jgi:ubiquinone/menaquinone biosynthesis C-methylase UbiE/uncharacterized protein YbaR (Trm112 family)
LTSNLHFCCPKCKTPLLEEENCFKCRVCQVEWSIDSDIPSFITNEFYWNQISKENMNRLLQIARDEGWRVALEKILLPLTNRYTFNYAVNESRADWHFMLPAKTDAEILDLGCGWGPVTIPLARHYRTVVGADTTAETLKFLQIRAKQEKIENIKLAHVDPLDYGNLPFSDSQFDLVVMNGMLEWIGAARLDMPPQACQQLALTEIRRILKPNGIIYIGIENRFSLDNFLGSGSHSKVPFADILPRPLANLWCKMVGKKDGYRTYIYSSFEYKKLLFQCGYNDFSLFLPIPSYRDPCLIIPTDNEKIIKYYVEHSINSIPKKQLGRFVPLSVKLFATDYSITASAAK